MALALTGCAGVPDSGPVHVGRQVPVSGGIDEEDIRVLPPGPQLGVSATAVVSGFLRAQIDSDGDYGVARSYLAPGTVWRPGTRITTYDETSLVVRRGPDDTVDVRAPRSGVIDGRGDYRAQTGTVHRRLRLVRLGGQWRISRLPSGVLLAASDAQRSLQVAEVYYLDRQGGRLVPEQVLVRAAAPGLATTLVRTLLAGPGRGIAPAVRTVLPPGTQLLGNVPVDDDGVAEVDLPGAARLLGADQRRALSAQLVFTLRQLSEVTSVRLFADGVPLAVPGVGLDQPMTAWRSFDPDHPPATSMAVAVRDRRVVGIGATVPHGLTSARDVRAPAVSPDGRFVAALREQGRRTVLLSGPADGPLARRLSADAVTAPTFDLVGDVLVVVRRGTRATLVEVGGDGAARSVALPRGLPAASIQALRVSPDGARVALVTGRTGRGALTVAALTATRSGLALTAARLVLPAAQHVLAVAWTAADALDAVASESPGNRSVVATDVDGYDSRVLAASGLPRDPLTVTGLPGRPPLVGTASSVWRLDGSRWRRLSPGADPAYPG